MKSRALLTGVILTVVTPSAARAQTAPLVQEVELRAGATAEKEIIKHLRVYVNPEMRTDGWNPDRYLLEAGLRFKPIDYFSVRGSFRGDVEEKKNGLEPGYQPRFAIQGHLPFGDFEAEARVMYAYGLEPGDSNKHRLRYRLGLDYGLPKTRFDFSASGEAFHDLAPNAFSRMRYSVGASYKFYKSKKLDQWIQLGYSLDYYLQERLNVHIPGLYYKVRF